MKHLIFLSFILSFFLCSCKRTPDLTKDEVYKILNEIIADDSLWLSPLCSQASHLKMNDEYGFSDQDKDFIQRQELIFKNFKFEVNKLKIYSSAWKSDRFFEVDTVCYAGNHLLSFPLISIDRKRVVFDDNGSGVTWGGFGGQKLFIKVNGHWKFEKCIGCWISFNEFNNRQKNENAR